MDLALDDHRIDDVAAVVDGHKPTHFDFTCALVDIDDTDVTAERVREIRWIVIVDGFESGFHSGRMICVSGERDLLNRLDSIGRAFDEELAGFPFEIVFVRFKQIRRDLSRLVFDLAAGHSAGSGGNGCAAARVSSESVGRRVSVTFFDEYSIERKSELLRHYLCIRRLVSLPL